jgi:hypothetical protein
MVIKLKLEDRRIGVRLPMGGTGFSIVFKPALDVFEPSCTTDIVGNLSRVNSPGS